MNLPPLPDIVLRADNHYSGEGLADAVRAYVAAAVAAERERWQKKDGYALVIHPEAVELLRDLPDGQWVILQRNLPQIDTPRGPDKRKPPWGLARAENGRDDLREPNRIIGEPVPYEIEYHSAPHIGDVNSQERGSGARYNSGKVDFSLLPLCTLEDEVRVWMHGREKYAAWNWAKGMPWSVPFASLMRHLAAWQRGEDTDPESGLPHIAHAMCNLRMLALYAHTYPEGDDRPKQWIGGVR